MLCKGGSDLDVTVDGEMEGLIPHGVVAVGHNPCAVSRLRRCRELQSHIAVRL